MLSQALTLATTLLALAAALCFWRLLRGPDIVDRIMALDTLSIIAIALIVGYGIRTDNPAYFEEFFGPVAQIYVVKDDDEVVKLANDSHYGLGGAVFSQDIERAKRMASRIETGMVYINWLTDTAPELPFGGVKRSGFGRELSDLGIKEFVNQKLVVVHK